MQSGTADFRDAETAGNTSVLAGRLFDVPGVTGVFFGYDFITVSSDGKAEWQHLKPAILGTIMEHFMSGQPVMAVVDADAPALPSDEFYDQAAEIVVTIKELLDTRAAGGRPGRRRHHLPRLPERHGVPAHEGRLRRLPLFDRDAEARHPEPAPAFRAGSPAR
jgi:hypothetical protein